MPELALYSPAVPPARSGQAVILHRLLAGVAPERYVLVANSHYAKHADQTATANLGATFELITPVTARPQPSYARREALRAPIDSVREIRGRTRQFTEIVRKHGVKTLVACTGDHYDFAAAAFAARATGVKLVPYLFDDYLYQCPSYLRPLSLAWETLAMATASRVIVTNEHFAEVIAKRHGVSAVIVHNAVEPLDLSAPPGPSPFSHGEKSVVFAGTIYNAHYDAFRNLIRALERFPDAKLHLFTFQKPEDLAAHGITGPQVSVEGFRPQREILDAQRHADVLFLPLAFESPLKPLLRTAAPGKTAEYLALGRPVLVHAPPDTFLSRYFSRQGCGVVVDQNDPAAVGEALARIFTDAPMRERLTLNAKRCAEDDFSLAKARATFAAAVGLA